MSSAFSITGPGTSYSHEAFRARVDLPNNLRQLSMHQCTRQDHLRESFSSPVPVPAPITASQEGQPQPILPSSDLVLLAHLVEKSKMFASDSITSLSEKLKKQELYPYMLGVHAWMKQEQREPQCTLPQRAPQTGQ